jgi:hypothetical protein
MDNKNKKEEITIRGNEKAKEAEKFFRDIGLDDNQLTKYRDYQKMEDENKLSYDMFFSNNS